MTGNGRITRFIWPFLVLPAIISCTTVGVQPTLPCPARPVLEAFVLEELESMTAEAKRKAAQNQIKLKGHIKKLEVRAGCNMN